MRKLLLTLGVFAFIGISIVSAQSKKITGVVSSSEDGQPIPGVSIIVKGTTVGTTTNIDGKYEINAPADGTTLIFSFIGMKLLRLLLKAGQLLMLFWNLKPQNSKR